MTSAEAEYAASAYTCKEIMFVRNVLNDLGFPVKGPCVLWIDNKAAISIAKNHGVTGRNKHFSEAIHYFRHLCDHQFVVPTHVVRTKQRADGFTKLLDKALFHTWLP